MMFESSRLLAAVPNVRHGFSTRVGGVSGGAFASLNMGRDTADPDANVVENRARFLREIGSSRSRSTCAELLLAQAEQVHGVEILRADRGGLLGTGDGLWTSAVGIAVGVRTADCAPVLIAALERDRAVAVAAVHAGWRGAVAGIVLRAIELLGVAPSCVRIAIGPTIGIEAFEVGEEVVEAARVSLGGKTPPMTRAANGKAHLDLRGLLVEQLIARDIPRDNLELTGGCTFANADRYYSHRRDRGVTGRHLSAIALVP